MWENDLAREFRKRDNKPKIGACIGTIISVNPLKATIYDGQIAIDDTNGYICSHLLKHVREYELTGDVVINGDLETTGSVTGMGSVNGTGSISGTGSVDGTGSIGGVNATSGSFTSEGNISANGSINADGSISVNGTVSLNGSGMGAISSTGTITHKELLKAGDMVLVLPSEDDQKFFIIDILEGVS